MGRHKYMLETHTIIHIFSSVCHAVAAMHHQKPPMAHRWVSVCCRGLGCVSVSVCVCVRETVTVCQGGPTAMWTCCCRLGSLTHPPVCVFALQGPEG